jgi:ribosomal protein S18 acetylase RimI-like enzyme
MPIVLRKSGPRDLDAIVDVFLECWSISYSGVMPAELVGSMTREKGEVLWRDALAREDFTVVVASNDSGPASTDTGPATPDIAPASIVGLVGYAIGAEKLGEVGSLYVSPAAQGTGTGRRLLTSATDDLRERGAHEARLWVFEANEPSRSFYERLGWTTDGRRTVLAEWGQPQIGMSRRLDD